MAIDTELAKQRTMRAWVIEGSGLPAQSVYWGQQDSKRAPEPAIEMRIISTHTIGEPWVSTQNACVRFDPLVAVALPGSNTLNIPAHGFTNGDGPVHAVSTGTLPGGLSTNVNYWVIVIDDATISLAASFLRAGASFVNGAPSSTPVIPIVITDAGSGTLTVESIEETLRAGREIQFVSRSVDRIGLMLECHTSDAVGMSSAMAILGRIRARQRLPTMQYILRQGSIGLIDIQRSRALHGIRNAVMFEPRAMMEVHFSAVSEEVEDGSIIERVEVTNQSTGDTKIIG